MNRSEIIRILRTSTGNVDHAAQLFLRLADTMRALSATLSALANEIEKEPVDNDA